VEKKLFLIVFLLTSCFFYGLERTLYVDNFNDILGKTAAYTLAIDQQLTWSDVSKN